MKVFQTKGAVDIKGVVHVDAAVGLAPGDVHLVMVLQDNNHNHSAQLYNFSDLTGKLHWQGDPLHEQQKLRNEW